MQTLGSRAANAHKVLTYLYQRPVLNAETVQEVTGISLPSSYKLIYDLEQMNILIEITGAQRGRSYLFKDYLDMFR